jgi:uncharacterized YceG family protein
MNKEEYKHKAKKIILPIILVLSVSLSIPEIYKYKLRLEEKPEPTFFTQFPVTVDFTKKTIIDDPAVESYLDSNQSPLQANTYFSSNKFAKIFSIIAISISDLENRSNLALVGGDKFITISPGLRKEEIVGMFGKELGWSTEEKKSFLEPSPGSKLPLSEGSFYPGVYVVGPNMTPGEVQTMMNNRFSANILERYASTTAEKVPLEMALNIASLIQKETLGKDDMRLVSGIIWNRIFSNMNLQLDATLQYAKANTQKTLSWWPPVSPNDKYIKSPYNTYLHGGLPPTPIASPSVAAVLAALNPLKTECLFYFHDNKGDMHCAPTYKEHVALLKKYFGAVR